MMIKILSLRCEQISSDDCLSNWPLGRRLKGGLEFSASLKISGIANRFSSQIEAQEKRKGRHTLIITLLWSRVSISSFLLPMKTFIPRLERMLRPRSRLTRLGRCSNTPPLLRK